MLRFGLKGFGLYSKLKSMFLNKIPWIFPSLLYWNNNYFKKIIHSLLDFTKESILNFVVADTEVEDVLDEVPSISLELEKAL